MTDNPPFDANAAHKYFSAHCFNKTWDYIDKPERTSEEDMAMLHSAITSLWHWTQREDAQPENLSVGYWQVSRVYALLRQPDNARRYAEVSLKLAEGSEPFYSGFAFEALARAEMVAGDRVKMQRFLEKAREALEQIKEEEDRQVLAKDLESIH